MMRSDSTRPARALAALFLAACIIMIMSGPLQSASAQTPPYYYVNGERITLTPLPDLSVVAFGGTPSGRQQALNVLSSLPGAGMGSSFERDGRSIALVSGTESTIRQTLRTLANITQSPLWIQPLLHYQGHRLIVGDEIILGLRADAGPAELNRIRARYDLHLIDSMPGENTWLLRVPAGGDALAISNQLHESGEVLYAEPNFIQLFERQFVPNDPLYTQQWHLQNSGQYVGALADADIDADRAWDVQTGSSDIIIAVLDDGVEMTHPELADRIVSPFDPYEGDAGPMPKAWDGHGTAVAGIIAAAGNNALGVSGICPQCRIMPIRIFYSPSASSTSLIGDNTSVAQGIEHAWQNGAHILSNSWGGVPSSIITEAFNNAANYGRGGLGSILTGATGNSFNSDVGYPANLGNFVAVGATNWCDEIKRPVNDACNGYEWYWGSSHGTGIDISAPGHSIYTTDITGSGGFAAGDYYAAFNGTSAATPIVSGILALILADDDTLTRIQAENRLYAAADDVNASSNPGYDTDLGWGRANAARTLLDWRVTTISGPIAPYSRDPLYEWDEVSSITDVVAYRIRVTTAAGSFITEQSRDADQICDSGLCAARLGTNLAGGSYLWQITAISADLGDSLPSPAQAFTVNTAALLEPTGTITDINGDPIFTWERLPEPSWYQLVLAQNGVTVFSIWAQAAQICTPYPGTCSLKATDYDSSYALKNGSYQWTVRAYGDAGYGPFPPALALSLNAAPPDLVQFSNPPALATDTQQPYLSFSAASGSSEFQIIVQRLTDNMTVWQQWVSRSTACGTPDGVVCDQVQIPVLLKDATSYRVYIQARGPGGITTNAGTPGGISGWQGPAQFTINIPNAPLPANLLSELQNVDVTLSWDDAAESQWFQLVITEANGATIYNKWWQKNTGDLICDAGRCQIRPQAIFYNRAYQWYVRAWGSGGYSEGGNGGFAQGSSIDFTLIPAPSTPDVASFITYNNETHQHQDELNYAWDETPNASWYQLAIVDSAGQSLLNQWYRSMALCSGGVCVVGPEGGADPGLILKNGENYRWAVRAWGPAGISPWSVLASFNINGDTQTAIDLSSASPSSSIASATPDFIWTAPSGATWYQLYVGTASGTEIRRTWLAATALGCENAPGSPCTATSAMLAQLVLANGNYVYALRSYGPAGMGPWSQTKAFTVAVPPPNGPALLISPEVDALQSNPDVTFTWQATSDTSYYRWRLYDPTDSLIAEQWLSATQAHCPAGGTCSYTHNLSGGDWRWSISVYGQGTSGSDYQESTKRPFRLLEQN